MNVIVPQPDKLVLDTVATASTRPKAAALSSATPERPASLSLMLPGTASPGVVATGQAGYSVIDDYYDVIHVRPAAIRTGDITAKVVDQVEVWNAYQAGRTLERIDVSGGDGIDVFGPALPFVFGPLESSLFTVEVSPNGPATIDARYDLVFSTDEGAPRWVVTGRRIIEWTLPPNWSTPYEETLAFKTEVLTAFNGTEQRIALRHLPRRSLEFTPLFDGAYGREGKRLLATWQHRAYAMADWARGVRCEGVPAGGQTVVLREAMPELTVGGMLVLRTGDQSQVMEISAIDGLSVTLRSPVASAFPAGTRVFPGYTVHLDPSAAGRRITSNVGETSLRFTQMHKTGTRSVPAAATTWRGLEVFLVRPDWGQDVSHDHNFNFTWLDTGRGLFDFRTPEDSPKDVRKFGFLLTGREAVRHFVHFFLRCRGRRGEFYAPTWDDDLVVPDGSTLVNGGYQLPIDSEAEAGRVATDLVYRNVYVRLRDGSTFLRHVVSGEVGPSGPVLVLDAAWPRTIDAAEVRSVSWAPRWRLASDDLTLSWKTDGTAEATLSYQTLEDA